MIAGTEAAIAASPVMFGTSEAHDRVSPPVSPPALGPTTTWRGQDEVTPHTLRAGQHVLRALKGDTPYFHNRVRWLLRTRAMALTSRAAPVDGAWPTAVWLERTAPLWVIIRVCELLLPRCRGCQTKRKRLNSAKGGYMHDGDMACPKMCQIMERKGLCFRCADARHDMLECAACQEMNNHWSASECEECGGVHWYR